MKRTYNLDRLYFQFLKPLGIPVEQLPFVVSKLYEQQFIEVFQAENETERYSETEKLKSKKHTKELFKLLQKVKNENV